MFSHESLKNTYFPVGEVVDVVVSVVVVVVVVAVVLYARCDRSSRIIGSYNRIKGIVSHGLDLCLVWSDGLLVVIIVCVVSSMCALTCALALTILLQVVMWSFPLFHYFF
jgi:hypothetical protein